ncbi:hypothetical protein BVY03_04210 [bacterium K02(2017)]|nr:hypothetical protein BVY03_04210 [bacterium K02(2017)]
MPTNVSSIAGGSGIAQGITDSKDIENTKMQFLTLLLAQLKNQDPLSPADTDQMTQQMMSLGQLEQLFDLNKNVEGLTNITSSSQLATYSNMVGKNALANGNGFEINGEDKGSFNFALNHVPNSSIIRVFDQHSNLVGEVNPNINNSGYQQLPFNGIGINNQPLDDGYYSYTVEALNDAGDAIPVQTYSIGTISSVRLEGGVPVIAVGKEEVGLTDIHRDLYLVKIIHFEVSYRLVHIYG